MKGNSRKKPDVWELRKAFHPQLKRFWLAHQHLNSVKTHCFLKDSQERGHELQLLSEQFADFFTVDSTHFVPLAIQKLHLVCEIDVLLLVSPNSAHLLARSDIDNRMKTLLDGLRMPQQKSELLNDLSAGSVQDPYYVLVEDDSQVSKLSVEYDTYLAAEQADIANDIVSAIISVRIRPTLVTMTNNIYL